MTSISGGFRIQILGLAMLTFWASACSSGTLSKEGPAGPTGAPGFTGPQGLPARPALLDPGVCRGIRANQ